MESPVFSIIIPVYNVELYLDKCIKSVLSQSYEDFELILVDDGSKDDSGKICDSYSSTDKRVKVIHKQNAGVSAARNTGLDKARGKYVCFVDSDDWIDNHYLQYVLDNIEGWDILFFGSIWHYEDGGIRSLSMKSAEYREEKDKGIFLLLENDVDINYFGFTWNKVFRRDIIEQYHIRFVEGLAISEDEVFTLAYCNRIKTLKIIDAPLYHYLWKKQGLTHKHRPSEEWIKLANSLQSLLSGLNGADLKSYYLKRIAAIYNIAAWGSNNPFRVMMGEWKMVKYCRNNHIPLPIKSIGREMINKFI